MENCLKYDIMHDFSVWLKTSSNPADIDRLRGDTGITFSFVFSKNVFIEKLKGVCFAVFMYNSKKAVFKCEYSLHLNDS